jgi:hypothetical protein
MNNPELQIIIVNTDNSSNNEQENENLIDVFFSRKNQKTGETVKADAKFDIEKQKVIYNDESMTPSKAANIVAGHGGCNGWYDWKLKDGTRLKNSGYRK